MALDRHRLLAVIAALDVFDDNDFLYFARNPAGRSAMKVAMLVGQKKRRQKLVRPPLYAEEWVGHYTEVQFYSLFR